MQQMDQKIQFELFTYFCGTEVQTSPTSEHDVEHICQIKINIKPSKNKSKKKKILYLAKTKKK